MSCGFPLHYGADAPWNDFTTDWYGRPPHHSARFSVSLDGDRLLYRFEADKAAECDTSLQTRQFVEGLWEQDVAELFIMAPSGRYQEFNLSPTGAWWCATFSDYREREAVLSNLRVETSARRDETRWSVQLSLRLRDLVVLEGLDVRHALWNVTAILSPRDPEYLSWGRKNEYPPDFHRTDIFLAPISQVMD